MHGKAKTTDLLITLYMHAAGMTVEIMHAACIPYSSPFQLLYPFFLFLHCQVYYY